MRHGRAGCAGRDHRDRRGQLNKPLRKHKPGAPYSPPASAVRAKIGSNLRLVTWRIQASVVDQLVQQTVASCDGACQHMTPELSAHMGVDWLSSAQAFPVNGHFRLFADLDDWQLSTQSV